ncbi:hypothetical protein VE03_02189 [Pseudogymnoascus sp. 23342-1-I1]|nr:hypothetical protein VE03_02189 [Pseudogymnoascus sp. 23342-1-I1]
MNMSRSAVRSSRWSKPIEQFLRESTQTSPRRGFASATRVTALQYTQQPRQQRLAGQSGGYGRLEQRRAFSYSPISQHGHLDPPKPGEELHVTFIDKDGDEQTIVVAKGDNLLDIAQANDVEMEGACGGSCACSTCHVIVEDEGLYDKMEEPDDDENDMLDLAFGLTETSRLGCQVKMSKELDGLRVKLPSMTRNLQASDFSQKNERSDN